MMRKHTAGPLPTIMLNTSMSEIKKQIDRAFLTTGETEAGFCQRQNAPSRNTLRQLRDPQGKPTMVERALAMLAEMGYGYLIPKDLMSDNHHEDGWEFAVRGVRVAKILDPFANTMVINLLKEIESEGWEIVSQSTEHTNGSMRTVSFVLKRKKAVTETISV